MLQDDEDCGLLGLAHMVPPEFSVESFLTAVAGNSTVGRSDRLAEERVGILRSDSTADQASARLLPEEKLLPPRERAFLRQLSLLSQNRVRRSLFSSCTIRRLCVPQHHFHKFFSKDVGLTCMGVVNAGTPSLSGSARKLPGETVSSTRGRDDRALPVANGRW